MRGNNTFLLKGKLIWLFHSENQASLLSETRNNRREGEHDVWGQTEAQRKATAQCKAKEISINHGPNWFPTCVRCLPRNRVTQTAALLWKTITSMTLRHKGTQSRVLDIKRQQCVEQTTPSREKLLLWHRTLVWRSTVAHTQLYKFMLCTQAIKQHSH